MFITNELFIKFLTDINASITCPVCGKAGWGVTTTHEMDTYDKENDHIVNHIPYARIHEERNSTNTFVGGIPVLSLTCSTCGYIRFHDYKTVYSHIVSISEKEASVESPNEE